jgi:DNA-binding transcriptional ArsR family regulator
MPPVDPGPYDLALERAVLGAALYSGEIARQVAASDPELFERDAHEAVHRALRVAAPSLNGAPPDIVLLSRDSAAAGRPIDPVLLAGLQEAGISVTRVDGYLRRLGELAAARRWRQIAGLADRANRDGSWTPETFDSIERLVEQARLLRVGPAARVPVQKLISLRQLFAAPPTAPCWLVDQLILQASNGWIGAGAKVGKSYLALDLLLACSLGEAWLGHFAVPRPLSVVLIQEEDSAWRVYQRARRLCRARGVDEVPTNFHLAIRTGLQLDDATTLDPFLANELEPRRPDLIVWDVFNRLHTKSEKHAEQMLPILRRVDRIRNETGAANLITHHSRKPGATGPDLATGGQKLRGPSEFWGWAENSIYLSPLKGKGVVRVEPESKDALLEPFGAHLEDAEDDSRRWVYDGAIKAKVDKGTQSREAIVAVLNGTWLSTAQIAEQLKLSERTIKSHLASLLSEGIVDSAKEPGRAGRKLWSAMPEPAGAASGAEGPPW